MFIHFEDDNIAAGARRLANYWRDRVAAFGDRAFLPLDMTGEGIFTEDEVELFSKGCVVRLPNDQAGRAVLCLAPNRLPSTLTPAAVKQLFLKFQFYQMSQFLMRSPKVCTTKQAVVFVTDASGEGPLDTSLILMQQMQQLLKTSFCITVHAMHTCFRSSPQEVGVSKPELAIQSYGKEWASPMIVHMEDDSYRMMAKLKQHGLDELTIPTTMGGKWHYSSFGGWLRQQRDQDKAAGAGTNTTPSATAPDDENLGTNIIEQTGCVSPPAADDDAPDYQNDLEALEAENDRLMEALAKNLGADALGDDNLFEMLAEKIGSTFDEEGGQDEDEIALMREIAQDLAKKEAPVSFDSEELHVRVRFALGVVAMIQEEDKCSLAVLLKDSKTEEILRELLTAQPQTPLSDTGMAVTTPNLSEGIATMLNSSTRTCPGVDEELYSKVRMALGILATLEETAGCPFERMLERPDVQDILRELVGPPVVAPAVSTPAVSTPAAVPDAGSADMQTTKDSPAYLDVLADHVASQLLTMIDSGSLTPDISKHLLQQGNGQYHDGAGLEDERSRAIGALLDSVLCM